MSKRRAWGDAFPHDISTSKKKNITLIFCVGIGLAIHRYFNGVNNCLTLSLRGNFVFMKIWVFSRDFHIRILKMVEMGLASEYLKVICRERMNKLSWNLVEEGTLPWANSCLGPSHFFLNEKKNIFGLMYIALFIKVIYLIQMLLKKKFILFFFQSYFFDEQSKFLILQFNQNFKFKCQRGKVSLERRKKVCC